MKNSWSGAVRLVVMLIPLLAPEVACAQGLELFGIGPVNRSMGGAATAAPIEAIGALYFNPATITALENQLSVGAEVITPLLDVTSSLGGRTGHTNSDSGWAAVPSIGLTLKTAPDSKLTYGFGLFGVAGYSVNYPSSTANPILFPQTPTPATPTPGFGNVYVDVSLLQLAPMIAYQVNDQLSVSLGPTIMAGRLIASPFAFTAPNDANGDGAATYPVGSGTQFTWGLGFKTGVYWKGEQGINWGAAFQSPQWFHDFTFNGTDERGYPRQFNFKFDYPLIVSLGSSYTGFEKWLFACDVRYFDWSNTSGTLGDAAQFAPTGELLGAGWHSTWAVALGVQYQMSQMLALRTGYTFSQSPIDDENAGFNVGSPLILKYAINVGTTINLSEKLGLHLTYYYAPENEVSGPMQSVGGPVPGSNVNYRLSGHAIALGITAKY
ncbi:MAG: OmpP1/FadL family transporter [Planctomycetales bacterium]